MKKAMLITAIIVSSFFSLSPVFSGETPVEKNDRNMWKAYNPKGEMVGTIKEEKGHYVFYDKDKIDLREGDKKNEWKMYNQENEFMGTLKNDTEADLFRIYNQQGKYIGAILKSEALLPTGHRRSMTRVPPEAAKLYLKTLEAYKQIR